jgi:hypothetical protein
MKRREQDVTQVHIVTLQFKIYLSYGTENGEKIGKKDITALKAAHQEAEQAEGSPHTPRSWPPLGLLVPARPT